MRRPRHLSAEEKALWQSVAKQASPLHPNHTAPKTKPDTNKAKIPYISPSTPINPFDLGERAMPRSVGHILQPSVSNSIANTPLKMDSKQFGRMKRGKVRPEARIDLHGMTLNEAHPALTGFILSAHASGKRLVLVITGKGKYRPEPGPIPTRLGVLRHQVPQWLHMAPLNSVVLQIAEAHISHGAHGALYVYLRRQR